MLDYSHYYITVERGTPKIIMLKEGNLTGPLVIRAVFMVISAVSWQQRPYPCYSIAVVPLSYSSPDSLPFFPFQVLLCPPYFSAPNFQFLFSLQFLSSSKPYIHPGR